MTQGNGETDIERLPIELKNLKGVGYYTIVTDDNVAYPHATDANIHPARNGDSVVRVDNPYGDNYLINLDEKSIKRINEGKFNLDGADYVYHSDLPKEDAEGPTEVARWS